MVPGKSVAEMRDEMEEMRRRLLEDVGDGEPCQLA